MASPFPDPGQAGRMSDCEDSLNVVNARAELARALDWLERFAARAALPPAVTTKLHVALDETLSNVLTHALAGAAEGTRQVALALRRAGRRVELEMIDDGPAFDPTRALVGSAATRITERRAGGVGLLFVKTVMDDIVFRRQDGHNRLIMVVRLAAAD
jgi:anti-sigma regulatory factor (Ser/Thr protein kinase)